MRLLMAGLLAFGTLGLSLGCGSGESGPRKYDVSGTVKFDGQDVADGDIIFQPENSAVGAEGGKIVNGKFSMKAREGKNTVQITGSRVVPGKKGPMGEDWVEQFIPDQYNQKSSLSVEVGSGKTTHEFNLKK